MQNKLKLVDQIMTALQQVIDPELQVDVVNLGLIYGIEIQKRQAIIKMTLTISGCPLSSLLQKRIERAVTKVDGIDSCQVQLVWYPVWSPAKMTKAAKQQLGFMQDETLPEVKKTDKIVDFTIPLKQLAEQDPDFVQIMEDSGFTRIKIPEMLQTVGRVMTVKLAAQAMHLDLKKLKNNFEQRGYRVINA